MQPVGVIYYWRKLFVNCSLRLKILLALRISLVMCNPFVNRIEKLTFKRKASGNHKVKSTKVA